MARELNNPPTLAANSPRRGCGKADVLGIDVAATTLAAMVRRLVRVTFIVLSGVRRRSGGEGKERRKRGEERFPRRCQWKWCKATLQTNEMPSPYKHVSIMIIGDSNAYDKRVPPRAAVASKAGLSVMKLREAARAHCAVCKEKKAEQGGEAARHSRCPVEEKRKNFAPPSRTLGRARLGTRKILARERQHGRNASMCS